MYQNVSKPITASFDEQEGALLPTDTATTVLIIYLFDHFITKYT
jgi:hypothetical protein